MRVPIRSPGVLSKFPVLLICNPYRLHAAVCDMTVFQRNSMRMIGLACCWVASAVALDLTERQALQLLRDSPHYRETQAAVGIARAEAKRFDYRPNPSVSTVLEGAGRTEFYVFEQPLAINGRRTLLRQAGMSAVRSAETLADHAVRDLEALLRVAFVDLVHAQERRAAIRRAIEVTDALVQILREREAAGEGSRFDRLSAEREVAERRTDLAECEARIAEFQIRLSTYLGDQVAPTELVAAGSLQPSYALPVLADALAHGVTARGDYTAETQKLEELRLESQAADRMRVPNPVLSGGLKRADVGGRIVSGPVLSVSIGLPVFSKGQAEKGLAEAEAGRVRARRHVIEREIRTEIRAAHVQLERRREIARAYESESEPIASELHRIAEVAYAEDERSVQELLDSYRVVYLARIRALELRSLAKVAEVRFDRSVAKDLLQ